VRCTLRLDVSILTSENLSDHFTEAEMREFEDPEYYADFRYRLESELNVSQTSLVKSITPL